MGYKGFQAVETKANKRDKSKALSEEHINELSPTAAAFRATPKVTATAEVKSKRLPGENPIDPRVVKADLKAARSLQKVYASQVAPKAASANNAAASSSASSGPAPQGVWGSPAGASAAAAAKPQNSSTMTGGVSLGGMGGWGGKSNVGIRGAGILNDASMFADLPSAGSGFAPDVRHAGGPRQNTNASASTDATALWTQAKAAKNGGNKKGGNKQQQAEPTHVAQTLVLGKKAAPKQPAGPVAEVDEKEAVGTDGGALPISVQPIILTADGKNKEISINGSLAAMKTKCEQFISGMPKNANAVAQLPIRGGLFMTVGGKKFSEVSTVYEPWMAESYFKALVPLIEGEVESATAHPYYQHGPNGLQKEDAAEAEVVMRIIKASPKDGLYDATTLIELEHVGAHNNKAQVKKVRASFKSFASGMLRAGEALVSFREILEDVLEESPLKGAAGGEITKKFAGKFNASLAAFKKALEVATA